jgi:hypothetical protein
MVSCLHLAIKTNHGSGYKASAYYARSNPESLILVYVGASEYFDLNTRPRTIDLQIGESSLNMSTFSAAGVIPAPSKLVSTRFFPSIEVVLESEGDDPPELGILEELPEPFEEEDG